jgi:hypothetical protein
MPSCLTSLISSELENSLNKIGMHLENFSSAKVEVPIIRELRNFPG